MIKLKDFVYIYDIFIYSHCNNKNVTNTNCSRFDDLFLICKRIQRVSYQIYNEENKFWTSTMHRLSVSSLFTLLVRCKLKQCFPSVSRFHIFLSAKLKASKDSFRTYVVIFPKILAFSGFSFKIYFQYWFQLFLKR